MHPSFEVDEVPAETLLSILISGLRRWKTILVVTTIVMAAAALYLVAAPRRYTSQALVIVSGQSGSILTTRSGTDSAYLPREVVQTQVEALRAPAVFEDVLASLGPAEQNVILGRDAQAPSDRVAEHTSPDASSSRKVSPTGAAGDRPSRREGSVKVAKVPLFKALRTAVEIEQIGLSSVISISATAASPSLAVDLANRIAAAGVDKARRRAALANQHIRTAVNDRVGILASRLKNAEDRAHDFRMKNGLYGQNNPISLAEQLNEKSKALATASSALSQAQSDLTAAQDATSKGDGTEVGGLMGDPAVLKLKEQLVEAEANVRKLGEAFGNQYSEVLAANAIVDQLKTRIANETQRIIRSLRERVHANELQVAALTDAVDDLGYRLGEAQRLEAKVAGIDDEAAAMRKVYQEVLAGSAGRLLAKDDRLFVAPVQVLSPATILLDKSYPQVPIILALAAICALILSFIAVIALQQLDRQRSIRPAA
jgi:uncharacterized protein involved in exopolysaccharide biosynthesis